MFFVCLCIGSLQASVHLMQKLNAVVLQCVVVVELLSLNGRSKVAADVFALISQWHACYLFGWLDISANMSLTSRAWASVKWQYVCKCGSYVPNPCSHTSLWIFSLLCCYGAVVFSFICIYYCEDLLYICGVCSECYTKYWSSITREPSYREVRMPQQYVYEGP